MLWTFALVGFFLGMILWITSYAILESGTIAEIEAFLAWFSKLDGPTSALRMLEILGIAHWGNKSRRSMCEKWGAALERTCRDLSDDVAETVWQKITL